METLTNSERRKLKSLIQEIEKIRSGFESMPNITGTNEEENCIDNIVISLDCYESFCKKILEMPNDIAPEPLDQGYEYMMGIRENVAHRM